MRGGYVGGGHKMQRLRLNEAHAVYLGLLARKDGTRRGTLSKRSSDNSRWQSRSFSLLHNLLFCFESESSGRPCALYLLEGCSCERGAKGGPDRQVHALDGGMRVRVWYEAGTQGGMEKGTGVPETGRCIQVV